MLLNQGFSSVHDLFGSGANHGEMLLVMNLS